MLRLSFITLLAWITLSGCGNDQVAKVSDKFMPENDLWQEDGFVDNGMTEAIYNEIIDIGYELYAPVAQKWEEKLTITRRWTDSTVNASSWRDGQGNTEIIMYGGLSRRSEVIKMSFALVLCHEIMHLYGGAPYIDRELRIGAEGTADYMGAGECLQNIANRLSDDMFDATPYMLQVCKNNDLCLRRLAGANGLGKLLAKLSGDPTPKFETPDPNQVKQTEVSYPRTTQCRLDTYFNATFSQERPRCWYKP